jgi:hypothetical protein
MDTAIKKTVTESDDASVTASLQVQLNLWQYERAYIKWINAQPDNEGTC